MGMQVADFLGAAGVDPYARAEDVLSARPGEVSALGEAFIAAAAALHSSGGLSALAGQLADASAAFNGESPTDLMAEVSTVQQTLAASPEVLQAIGGPLCALAGETAMAQQQVTAALMAMEEQAVSILQAYAQAADVIVVGATAWWNQHVAAGAALVQSTYASVSDAVDTHDAKLGEVLLALQAVGYLMPPDVDAGVVAPPAAGTAWVSGSDVGPYHKGADPEVTAAWWAGLSEADQAAMVQHYPQLLALLHGLPAEVYHAANVRQLIDDTMVVDPGILPLAQAIWDSPELAIPLEHLFGATSVEDVAELSPDALSVLIGWALPGTVPLLDQLRTLRKQQEGIEGVRQSIHPGEDGKNRYLLEYNLDAFDGDGKAAIGIGEVDTADNVAVVVQGATHDLASTAAQTGDAEAVLAEMDNLDDAQDNAVIVYEGYDNPGILGAISHDNAQHGGMFLTDDLNGYEAAHQQATGGESAHTTVIAHSYGTLTTGYALRYGATSVADDVVLYGSPGVGVAHVSDLGMDPERVYVAFDGDDILRWLDLNPLTGMSLSPLLGPNPAFPEFGAIVLGTDGVDGHGDYFGYEDGAPNEALANAAAIAVDRPETGSDPGYGPPATAD